MIENDEARQNQKHKQLNPILLTIYMLLLMCLMCSTDFPVEDPSQTVDGCISRYPVPRLDHDWVEKPDSEKRGLVYEVCKAETSKLMFGPDNIYESVRF